ncbi:MAG TPA: polyprenyl synthetase family protein [Sandaracinaceae bacterium]
MNAGAGSTTWLAEVKASVEAHLSAFFAEERARLCQLAPDAAELVDAIEGFTMRGGKRLRPALAYAAYRSVQPSGRFADVADACAALELLQSYLLIHDDWMDGDEERRGGPAVHALMRSRRANAHLGDSLAILAGDLASAQSWRLIARCGRDPERRAAALEVALRMHEEVIVGQQLDLIASPDVSRMHQLKTGSYTVRGPLALGAVLGGASPQQRDALERFGAPVGEAFQMRDDLLGAFGDPRETGKPAGNDLRAGKRNAVIRAAEARCSEAELAPVRAVLGKADASDAQVQAALEVIERSGAKADVEARLRELLDEALAVLASAPLEEPGRGMLRELAQRLAVRAS